MVGANICHCCVASKCFRCLITSQEFPSTTQVVTSRRQGPGLYGRGYTIIRNYPDPALRPPSAVLRVVQDCSRSGDDLLRSLDFIPEIVTAEISVEDCSLLLRLQTPDPSRIEQIASALRIQSAVVMVQVARTTAIFRNRGPEPKKI